MVKRKKRLEKQIRGLLKQSVSHDDKIRFEKGRLPTTVDYWVKEKEGYDRQIEDKLKKLREMEKKKLRKRAR